MFKLECFTQAFAMIKYFSVFPRGINTETPPFAETNDAAKLVRKNECCKFSNAPFCAGAEWRTMAQFFWRCFSEFFRELSSSAVFPHAVSQVRGQLPHKSGDKPLPCHKKAVILHRNSKSPHAHRTLIALPSHTRIRVAAMSPAGVPVALKRVKKEQDYSRLNKINFGYEK